MNNTVQQLLGLIDVSVQALILEYNVSHKHIADHIRDFIAYNVSKAQKNRKILYTTRESEVAFSEKFSAFCKFPPGHIPLRENTFVHEKIYEYAVLIAHSHPHIISFIFTYLAHDMKTASALWAKIIDLTRKCTKITQRLKTVEDLLSKRDLDNRKTFAEIEEEITRTSLSSVPSDILLQLDDSINVLSRSPSPSPTSTNTMLTRDIICYCKREPAFNNYKIDVLLKSKSWLQQTLEELTEEKSVLLNLLRGPEKSCIDTFEKFADEIARKTQEYEELVQRERFLFEGRTSFASALEGSRPSICWAFQHEFDKTAMSLLELVKSSIDTGNFVWLKHTGGLNGAAQKIFIFDMLTGHYSECPPFLFIFITEQLGLVASGAPWVNLKYQEVPAFVDWHIKKNADCQGEEIAW